jgi:response regulator RpfG family c-di-GMP phosphodiesterase
MIFQLENGAERCVKELGVSKKKMLVVDDVQIDRLILKNIFKGSYDVLEARDGKEALGLIYKFGTELSMVLLDILMPGMDGFELLRVLNRLRFTENLPVILITSESGDEKKLTGYNLGVADIIAKPYNSEIVFRRVNNVANLYSHKKEMARRLHDQKKMLETQAQHLRRSNQFIIDALSTVVEFRNLESGEHIKRIRALVQIILESLRKYYPLSNMEIETISSASVIHDIGKIAIPDNILLKPGKLTPEEFEIMKTHTTRGCEMLSAIENIEDKDYYAYCYDICRHHHERWDGGGYPDGLKGDEISVWAHATALADTYDALTSKRVYKDAIPHEEAVRMILNGECGAFDPNMMERFVVIQDELYQAITAPGRRDKDLLFRS